MKITLRIYSVPGTPITYQWDYQVDNISMVSNYGDAYVTGIDGFILSFPGTLSDLANGYASANWTPTVYTTDAGITHVTAYSNSGYDVIGRQ